MKSILVLSFHKMPVLALIKPSKRGMQRRLIFFLVLAVMAISGCKDKEKKENVSLTFYDCHSPPFCNIEIFCSPYDINDNRPIITILWDGQKIYDSQMPYYTGIQLSGGMPVKLISIQTSPGKHKLVVIDENKKRQEVDIEIKAGDRLCFMIFGYDSKGNKVLIESLGANPIFL